MNPIKITYVTFKNMLLSAAEQIVSAKEELTTIDSRFGDADHGVTMEKIAHAMQQEAKKEYDAKETLCNISATIMRINGGSAVPLWSTFFEGMAQSLPVGDMLDENAMKAMFAGGLSALGEITTAKVGDKTMMDTILPAIETMQNCEEELSMLLQAGAQAAVQGAKATEGFAAKFGRAKNYKEQTLGTPDAGAVSAMYFFVGLALGCNNQ